VTSLILYGHVTSDDIHHVTIRIAVGLL